MTELQLREKLKAAMRAGDSRRRDLLRAVLAACKNLSIEKKGQELADADVVSLLKRELKQRRETLEFAEQAGRAEAVAAGHAEVAILESLLPQQMSRAELEAAVRAIVSQTGATAMGPVMKALSESYGGTYDGKQASAVVREVLATG
jgi:uncharacterized protein YqeY